MILRLQLVDDAMETKQLNATNSAKAKLHNEEGYKQIRIPLSGSCDQCLYQFFQLCIISDFDLYTQWKPPYHLSYSNQPRSW